MLIKIKLFYFIEKLSTLVKNWEKKADKLINKKFPNPDKSLRKKTIIIVKKLNY